MKAIIAAGLALALSAGVAHAAWINKVAASGKPLILFDVGVLNVDCSPVGATTVKVLEAPEHGRVTAGKASVFPKYHPSNPRSKCNTRRVQGVLATYVSKGGYQGTDRVTLEIIGPTGGYVKHTFNITVR
jgi:hypothetical protein